MKTQYSFLLQQMNRELPSANPLKTDNQGLRWLGESELLFKIMGKRIIEQAAKKTLIPQPIDVDEIQPPQDRQTTVSKVKFAEEPQDDSHQFCESQSEDEDDEEDEYVPWQDSSESESVQRYKLHRLRMRDLKVISKQEFQRKLLPNQPIQIDDVKPEQFDNNSQKNQNLKVALKEEAGGRNTKKTKMEFLLKNKGVLLPKRKNKKILKSLQRMRKELN